METVFIGIDVSKLTLDFFVHRVDGSSHKRIDNDPKYILKLFKNLGAEDSHLVVTMENTGLYNFSLYEVLGSLQHEVYVVDPKHLKRSIGLVRGKNDKVDAQRICEFGMRHRTDLREWKPIGRTIKTLKLLMGQRRFKVRQRRAMLQQISELKSIPQDAMTRKMIRMHMGSIKRADREIRSLEAELRRTVAQDEELTQKIERVRTIPGVGEVTAWTVAAKTCGFTQMTNPRKLACFAGVVPFEQQSGSSIRTKPRVSKMADMQLKSILQMAAMRAVRMENDLKHYYQRKVAEGKNKMSVLNAVRNKIIHLMMALIRNRTFYQNRLEMS